MKEDKKKLMQEAFSQRLRELRKQHHHTQAYLAKKLHISKSCISNWEAGVRMPDAQMLLTLAETYTVTCAYLVGNSKRPTPYVPEDKFIDKNRYLDMHRLCETDQISLKSYYEFLLSKYKG